MSNVFFIAWHDLRHLLRQGSALLWVFVMPPVFFYFIGTVTAGFSGTMSGAVKTPLVVAAEAPGFLRDQIDRRLRDNDFEPEWRESAASGDEGTRPERLLSFDSNLSERVLADNVVHARFDTRASAVSRNYEAIRIQRSLYTTLADVVAADARSPGALSPADLDALNREPRVWRLEVAPAGQRKVVPGGFEQAIPGILVMFTLLVLVTNGSAMLVVERNQGLLRRLVSAPISRAEVVAGKWAGRMVLAVLQIGTALLVGTLWFRMDWGPDLAMILVVLGAWAAFCATAGLALGSLARTDAQAAGLGVLVTNLLAALGGCWWPIEITPGWMQLLQKALPTGWTMDALHRLISFQAGAAAAVPHVLALLAASLFVGVLAVRRFRYQ